MFYFVNSEILQGDLGEIIKKTKYSKFQENYFAGTKEPTLATNQQIFKLVTGIGFTGEKQQGYGNHKTKTS